MVNHHHSLKIDSICVRWMSNSVGNCMRHTELEEKFLRLHTNSFGRKAKIRPEPFDTGVINLPLL